MNKLKGRILLTALTLAVFSLFTFSSVTSAIWYRSEPISNGSYQMQGRNYLGYIFGHHMWQTITTNNLFYNYAALTGDSPSGYQDCDYDKTYVFIEDSYDRASFKHFNFSSSTKLKNISKLVIYIDLATMFDLSVNNADKLFIRFKDADGLQYEYSMPLYNSGSTSYTTFGDGRLGQIYRNSTPYSEYNPPFTNTDYHFAYFMVSNIYWTIDMNTIEAGFENGTTMGYDRESRVTCTELLYDTY